ncbi:DinB family protein [Parapedobacter sp. GCM10030251]|uniref:DinB family protein n=1 Tax=Parapedobacter sp. GCM10030251 TaxID=3273419 RepID=UPI0036245493
MEHHPSQTKNSAPNDKLIQNIISQLLDIQEKENWLDENFKKKIGSVGADNVFERPLPELHSVAELISHVLVWRLESIRKLKGLDANLTVDSPENWRTNDQLKEMGWVNLQTEFYKSTYTLIELLSDKDDSFLEKKYRDGYSFKYLIEGLIHHDLYHLGQLGITIKFLKL